MQAIKSEVLPMAHWMNLGQQLKMNAKKFPDTVALCDARRRFTYPELNRRVNRLANGLMQMGLSKGDKLALLMENSIEIVEFYLAAAKTGIVIVPVNFRLVGPEVAYIVDNADAKAMAVDHEFTPCVDTIKIMLPQIPAENFIVVNDTKTGYREYEALLAAAGDDEPDVAVLPADTWILIYTSGTTGKPKGVVRSHESHIAFYLINAVDFGFDQSDVCMNVMPLCHINSTFFTFTFTYIGATVYIHPARSFRPEQILEIVEREKITFISLIPTHYNLILNVSAEGRQRDTRSIRKLLCSSAPVRKTMKTAIMEFFPGVQLYEGYGSTEAGIVTVLRPEDQMRKLGSIGFESLGTERVKILDPEGNQVAPCEVGELYSKGPMLFDEYYKLPAKTADAFRDGWFSAGDMARMDDDGYYEIVDRKDNMIITGGEHVYPSEVEEVIGSNPDVFDVAAISLPDDKWGEKVAAVVIPMAGVELTERAVIDWCRERMAGYKRPKQVFFITQGQMPRTATGKILHRILRESFADGEPVFPETDSCKVTEE
jgi:acyl-CoA synthetase (AMP-forming)/AMP-acid ligase II